MELAVASMHQRPYRAQPLRHVCPVPPDRGPDSLRIVGPVCPSLGLLRPEEEECSPRTYRLVRTFEESTGN